MNHKQKHHTTDPLSLQRAALLREIDAASLSEETKRLIKLVTVQPDGVASGRAALAAAIQRAERSAR